MNRRQLITFMGLSPLALISFKTPKDEQPIVRNLIKRWKQSKVYTLAVFDAMPAAMIEYSPTEDQMSFSQHFMHFSLINNFYIGILMDTKSYPDFNALIKANFLVERSDNLMKRPPETNKQTKHL